MNFILTKTKYIQFIQCPKTLWLLEKKKELKENPSTYDLLKMEEGNEVGKLAQEHPFFENGVLVSSLNAVLAKNHTLNELSSKNTKYIYEACFNQVVNNVNCLVRVDILRKNDDGTVDLIEVKSSSKVKDYYYHDLAFQKEIVGKSGLIVKNCFIMYVNKNYTLQSEKINLEEYFIIENLNNKLNAYSSKVLNNIDICRKIINIQEEPNYPTGSHCSSPNICPFFSTCNAVKKEENSINNLRNLSYKKKEKLIEENIYLMEDISDSKMLDFSEVQQIQILCSKNPSIFHIEPEKIQSFIKELKYPLHFLDFEALISAIPFFEGMKPQSFVVYQASIHKQEKPNTKPNHSIYLHEEFSDPRLNIINFLKNTISEKGSIIVYHKQFEESQLNNLKRDFPEYSQLIESWISRLWDLEKVFSSFWFYDTKQLGSTSIKKILPVLVPNLSYKQLSIQDGNSSVAHYLNLIKGKYEAKEKTDVVNNLNLYNQLDTLAMIKILNKLKWLCSKSATYSSSS